MAQDGIQINTGVGRIVWGHPGKPQHKTDQSNQKVLKDGQPINQWTFGVAFPRAEFEQLIWPAMFQEAARGYPGGVPGNFSWKYKDGDTGVDRDGKPLRDREGYAGHIILTVSTEAFAPPMVRWDAQGNRYPQIEPHEIKTGDFVVLTTNIKVNVPSNRSHTPGLYINPVLVCLVGYGQEIVSRGAVDPVALLGQSMNPQLPPGASATPMAPATNIGMPQPGGGGMPMQQAPMQQAPMQQAPMQQAPMQQAPMQQAPMQQAPMQQAPMQQGGMLAPGQMPPPAHDFVQNAGQMPQQGGMPGMMPPR